MILCDSYNATLKKKSTFEKSYFQGITYNY